MDSFLPVLCFSLFLAGIVAIILMIIFRGIETVGEGSVGLIERMGEFNRAVGPGRHFVTPIFERVAHRVVVSEINTTLEDIEVMTADQVTVNLEMVIVYRIAHFNPKQVPYEEAQNMPAKRIILWNNAVITIEDLRRAVYDVGDWIERTKKEAFTTLSDHFTTIDYRKSVYLSEKDRESMAKKGAPPAIPRINLALTEKINAATRKFGVEVTRVNLVNLKPDQAVRELWDAEREAESQAAVRRRQAESEREIAQNILGLKSEESYLAWRYIEAMRERGEYDPANFPEGFNPQGYFRNAPNSNNNNSAQPR